MFTREKYLAFHGHRQGYVPRWEMWSNPDAESYITGIDYYSHPRLCRERLAALYPDLELPVPPTDDPISRPVVEDGQHAARWGDGFTWEWDWGSCFHSEEEVLAFSPLEHPDFRDIHVVESHDYSSEEILFQHYRQFFPPEWFEHPPENNTGIVTFYNTLFMWPLLTFGWENFMNLCLEDEFERIMREFAELSRRTFKAFARLPVEFVVCHDDITNARGPICPPAWMRKNIYPYYEEFWGDLKAAGKKVIFMCDGCMDAVVDDVMACGAHGVYTEPYTDFKAIARKYPHALLCGEGDNRILQQNDRTLVDGMVESMRETAALCGGYVTGIGNHITYDLPPEIVKYYLDRSAERIRF